MSPYLKLAVGFVSLMLGLGYLYRPDLIERMNALLREYLLNGAYIALERKKWGVVFLQEAVLVQYMGWSALAR